MAKTKIPSIPNSARADRTVKPALDAMREAMNVMLGRQGDVLDKAVTYRDLISSGLAVPSYSASGVSSGIIQPSPGGTTGGTGGYTPDLTPPPIPTNLVTAGFFGAIMLTYEGFAGTAQYAEIWRHDADILGAATMIALAGSSMYIDYVDSDAVYYYWVRFVSKEGIAGPYNASPGTTGQAASNATKIEIVGTLPVTGNFEGRTVFLTTDGKLYRYHSGAWTSVIGAVDIPPLSIDESKLAALLSSRIDLIDASGTGLIDLVSVLDGQLNGDVATPGTVNYKIDAATSSLVSQTELTTTLGSYVTNSNLTNNYYTATATDQAIAAAVLNLVSTTDLSTALGDYTTTASLVAGYYTKTATDSAISAAVLGLASETYVNTSLGSYVTSAYLTSNYYTQSSTDSAIAGEINQVQAALRGTTLGLPLDQWNVNGQSIQTVADGKVGQYVLRLSAAAGYPAQPNLVPIDLTRRYRVGLWARPQAGCDGLLYFSLRQSLDDSGSNWGPVNGGRSPYYPSGVNVATHNANFGTDAWGYYEFDWYSAHWQAGVQYVQPEFLNNYTGTTGYWEVQGFSFRDVTDVNEVSAAVSVETSARVQTDGELQAQYTVKVDTNGYVAGFGLASTVSGGTPSSAFIIRADKFAIIDPADVSGMTNTPSAADIPFEIVGGVTYMKVAMIRDATITNAKISDIEANKITAGNIDAARMQVNAVTALQATITTLSSIRANLGSITAGNITLDTSGYIRGGQTGYATGTGFWLGYSGGYKMSIGDTNKYIRWDGSTLSVGGDIISTGNIVDGAVGALDVNYNTSTTNQSENVETTVATCTVNAVTGKPVSLIMSVNFTTSCALPYDSPPITTIKVKRGATELYSKVYTGAYSSYDLFRLIYDMPPSSGSTTYTVAIIQRSNPDGTNGSPFYNQVNYVALQAQQLKR